MKSNNRKGMALALVLMIMSVLSILGISILTISLAETKQVVYQDKKMQAYYLAKSGADTVVEYILSNPDKIADLKAAGPSEKNEQLDNGSFTVSVTDGDDADEFRVQAIGNVDDIENSTTAIIYKASASDFLDKAIYTNADLDIQQMEVVGDIQSGGKITYGSNYKGTAFPYQKSTIEIISPFPTAGSNNVTVKKSIMNITSSTKFDTLNIDNNGVVNIVTGGNTIEIVANNVNIKGNLTIDASGGGLVKFFIHNGISVTTQGLINNKEPKNLFVYLKKDSLFHIQANMIFNGYIIGPEAKVMIQSDKSTINGAVFADMVFKNLAGNGGHGKVNYVALPTDITDIDATQYRLLRWEK